MIEKLFARILSLPEEIMSLSIIPKIFSFFMFFVRPLYEFIGVLVVFVIIDMITSIWAQYKQVKRRCHESGEKRKTKGEGFYLFWCGRILWRVIKGERIIETVDKIVAYSLSLMICVVFDYYVLRIIIEDSANFLILVSLTNTAFVLILAGESRSILRNLNKVTPGNILKKIEEAIGKKTKRKP